MLRPFICQLLLLTLVVSVFGTGSVAAPPTGMKVWVVGDSTRIDPTRNSAFEDNLLLFPDGLSGNYQESNLIWDAVAVAIGQKARVP